MNVCLVQLESTIGDPAANLRAAEVALRSVDDKADVIVLPEAWNLGFLPADLSEAEPSRDGPAYALARRTAAELRANLVAGSILCRDGPRTFNRAFVFDRAGAELAACDKVHLFSPMGEDDPISPGREPGRFELDGLPCGLLICYDLRFPEIVRSLAFGGARILFVPAQWPGSRIETWRTLLRARAIENSVFVVGCNGCGAGSDGPVGGRSMVVGPSGDVRWEAGGEAETGSVSIDPAEVDAVRAALPAFDHGRERYGENR
jgi:predicted amidohydrolase